MTSEPVTAATTDTDMSERGLLIAVLIMVLMGVGAMLMMI